MQGKRVLKEGERNIISCVIKRTGGVCFGAFVLLLCSFSSHAAELETYLYTETETSISGNGLPLTPETEEETTEEETTEETTEETAEEETETELETVQELQEKIEPSASVTAPDELYKWGIDYSNGTITRVNDSSLLPEVLVIPEGVIEIASQCFLGNNTIKEVYFPDSLTSIYMSAFHNCANLEKVVFGTGIQWIAGGVFSECRNLTLVDLSKATRLENMGDGVFGKIVGNAPYDIDEFYFNINCLFNQYADIRRIFSEGVGVKHLTIIDPQQYTSSSSLGASLCSYWDSFSAFNLGISQGVLEQVTYQTTINNSQISTDIAVYLQHRNLAEHYGTELSGMSADELWTWCFSEDSARKANLYNTGVADGGGVISFSNFMDFYNTTQQENRETFQSQTLIKLDQVYSQLVVRLVDESSNLAACDLVIEVVEPAVNHNILVEEQNVLKELPEVDEPVEIQELSEAEEPVEIKEVPKVEEPVEIKEVPKVEEPVEIKEVPKVEESLVLEEQEGDYIRAELEVMGLSYHDGIITGIADENLLPEILRIPEGVKAITGFAGNTKIREIIFPDSLEIIGLQAFTNCTELKSITLGSGIEEIYAGAFINCNLVTVDLSRAEKLNLMGEGVFGAVPEYGSTVIGSMILHDNILKNGSYAHTFWNVEIQDLDVVTGAEPANIDHIEKLNNDIINTNSTVNNIGY